MVHQTRSHHLDPAIGRRARPIVAAVAAATMLIVALATASSNAGALESPATTVAPPTTVVQIDCPQTTSNAIFVRYLYRSTLDRCPDAGGLAYWTAKLDGGTSRQSVTDSFVWAHEVIAAMVVRYYHSILEAAPTTEQLVEGVAMGRYDVQDIAIPLLAGDTYYSTFSTPQAWLSALYPRIFEGRTADAGGLAYFSAMLGSNPTLATRTQVVEDLVHSNEKARFWVNCSYEIGLGRTGSNTETAWWMGWLQTPGRHFDTQGMWAFFLASPEGQAFAQTQPNLYGA